MSFRSSLVALAAVAVAGGAASSPATAATTSAIVYVKDGDVWQVQPDGKNGHAVTTDGTKDAPYGRPRLAPDGTIWALKGTDVVHLAADGHAVATMHPATPKDSEGVPVEADPTFFDLSPDATMLAYGVDNLRCTETTCNTDGVTAILDTSGKTLAQDTRFGDPSWIGNDRLIGSDGLAEGEVRLMGAGGGSELWYVDGQDVHPEGNGWTREPAMSPDRTQLAVQRTVTSYGNYIFTYKVPAAATPLGFGVPEPLCMIDGIVSEGGSPTWSPDGTHVVAAGEDGVFVADFSAVHAPGDCGKATIATVAPAGATQPDWGVVPAPEPVDPQPEPKPVPAPTPAPTPAPSPGPAPGPVTPPVVAPQPAAAPTLTVPAQRLKAIVRSGLKLQVAGALPGRLAIVVKAKGKVVGKATVTVPKSGTFKATIKLGKATARALSKARSATLTVSAGGLTRTVKVQR